MKVFWLHKIIATLTFTCLTTGVCPALNKQNYDIIAIGSAFLDYIIKVNDEELSAMDCGKGSWAPIEYSSLQSMLQKHDQNLIPYAGRSGANVVRGLAKLGQRCAVIGRIGSDDHALFYLKCLQDLDITPLLDRGELPTGQAICFVTPDGQRTMRAYVGSSHEVQEAPLDPTIFNKIKLFHVESYQLQNPSLLKKALEEASKNSAKISLDLSNAQIVKLYKDELLNIIPKYVDIVFASDVEAFELTHLSPQEACDFLATFCEAVVIIMGDKGSWVKSNNIKLYTPAFPVEVVDTTGARELFSSGFLHGYLNNAPLQACVQLGSYIASKVVQHYGSDIPDYEWKEIYKFLDEQQPSTIAEKSKYACFSSSSIPSKGALVQ
jgi:sugar/nucleoside kinase (ribokinase family)